MADLHGIVHLDDLRREASVPLSFQEVHRMHHGDRVLEAARRSPRHRLRAWGLVH
jgi:hypothetical protein